MKTIIAFLSAVTFICLTGCTTVVEKPATHTTTTTTEETSVHSPVSATSTETRTIRSN